MGSCVEVVRLEGAYAFYDTKNRGLGAVAVFSTAEYQERYAKVSVSGDAVEMFDGPHQRKTLSQDELAALADYIAATHEPLADMEVGDSVIAYTDRRDLPMDDLNG